jgi:hypothetical protein
MTVSGFTIVSALTAFGTKRYSNDQAIGGTEGHSLRHLPSLDVKLMTKNQDLSLQRDPRPQQ